MSGHSKWSKIKRDKGANDAKRGAIFTKLGNQIAIAARGGVDPDLDSTLAMAIEKAKAANMPVSNIQRAIDRVADKNSADLQEITYEGYGPGGVGIIIETATDNRNRTLPEVKTALVKNGGSIADAGSVSFQFDRKGVIRVEASGEDALLTILDAGAEDFSADEEEVFVVTTLPEDFGTVREALEAQGIEFLEAAVKMIPDTYTQINEDDAKKFQKMLDLLEDDDDVQEVYHNAEFPEGWDE